MFEFEKKRNVPVKYDRALWQATRPFILTRMLFPRILLLSPSSSSSWSYSWFSSCPSPFLFFVFLVRVLLLCSSYSSFLLCFSCSCFSSPYIAPSNIYISIYIYFFLYILHLHLVLVLVLLILLLAPSFQAFHPPFTCLFPRYMIVRAMKRIQEIKHKREAQFIRNRFVLLICFMNRICNVLYRISFQIEGQSRQRACPRPQRG